jgi:hypothetical protein
VPDEEARRAGASREPARGAAAQASRAGVCPSPGRHDGTSEDSRPRSGIKNIGEDHSLARTSDDDDDDLNIGDSVYFDYDDAGDAGIVVSPSGWIVQVNTVGELAANAVTPRTIGDNKCVFTTTYTVLAQP